jgi:hypothetical protein
MRQRHDLVAALLLDQRLFLLPRGGSREIEQGPIVMARETPMSIGKRRSTRSFQGVLSSAIPPE